MISITLADGRTLPFTLALLPALLRDLPNAELNAVKWSEAVRRELVSRHRNPPEPNAVVEKVVRM
jgi:hypothetical protein